MTAMLWVHVASGLIALLAGSIAAAARKGGAVHGLAGTGFCLSMLVLGVTAALLEPFRSPPGSPVGGIMVCYFVVTGWLTARRREGGPGRAERIACVLVLAGSAATLWSGFTGATTPAGRGPIFAFAAICLLAGLLDINALARSSPTAAQRLSRHLWRMCFAFFIATGSFFLGQQDVLPEWARGSPVLFALAFAPFGLMLFWLVRLRFPGAVPRVRQAPFREKRGLEVPVSLRRLRG
jgi:hypothetical protein